MGLYDLYMEYTKPFGGSTIFHRWAIISCIASLQERKTSLPMGGIASIWPNMYTLLIGNAGSGKTTVGDVATKLLKDYNRSKKNPAEHIYFAPDKITPARLLMKLEESYHKEKNHSALYQYASELSASILDIGGGSVVPDLLKLFDCGEDFTKETMGGGNLNIIRPCFNLLGCTTTNFLGSFLSRDQVGTGLAARIIFVADFNNYRFGGVVPKGDKALKHKMMGQIERIHKASGEFTMSPEALMAFEPWNEHVTDTLHSTADDTFKKDYLARKSVQARKVAMALSIARDSSLIITGQNMLDAIRYIEEIEPGLSRCFGTTSFNRVPDLALQILTKLPENQEWMKKPLLLQALWDGGMSGKAQELRDTIETLVDAEMMEAKEEGGKTFFRKMNYDK